MESRLKRRREIAGMPEVVCLRSIPARRTFLRGQMISLKKYLDAIDGAPPAQKAGGAKLPAVSGVTKLAVLAAPNAKELFPVAMAAYRSASRRRLQSDRRNRSWSFSAAY